MDHDDRGEDGQNGEDGQTGEDGQNGEGGQGGGGGMPEPSEMLSEMRAVRQRARRARHAYWFPLVLFGLLTCASIPFYLQPVITRTGVFGWASSGPGVLQSRYFVGPLAGADVAYYWLAALLAGVAATALWYRWRGDQVGLRTPTRGYLVTGLVLLVLALLIPVIVGSAAQSPLSFLMPGDLLIRGTFPPVIIAVCMCVLAWAERSIALTAIAAGYLGLSLVASPYDIENVFYRLGWNLSPAVSGLPNVVLPGLMLLISGAGAWVTQRRPQSRPAPAAEAR